MAADARVVTNQASDVRLLGAEAIEAFGSADSVACKQRGDNIIGKNDSARMGKQIELAGVWDLIVHRLDS